MLPDESELVVNREPAVRRRRRLDEPRYVTHDGAFSHHPIPEIQRGTFERIESRVDGPYLTQHIDFRQTGIE